MMAYFFTMMKSALPSKLINADIRKVTKLRYFFLSHLPWFECQTSIFLNRLIKFFFESTVILFLLHPSPGTRQRLKKRCLRGKRNSFKSLCKFISTMQFLYFILTFIKFYIWIVVSENVQSLSWVSLNGLIPD